jgi:hypothetical protein
MALPAKLLWIALVLFASVPRAEAWDVSIEGPSPLQLSVPALSAPLQRTSLSIAQGSALLRVPLALPYNQVANATSMDLPARKSMARVGYGLATSLGFMVGGAVFAAQTRPKTGADSGGVCYEDQTTERRFLLAGTGVIAIGAALSSALIVRLLRLRRAHPDARPSRATRVAQALIGLGSAAATSGVLWAATIPCTAS